MSLLGLLMFGFLAEAGESMETRVRRVSAYYVAYYAAVYRIPVGLVEAVIKLNQPGGQRRFPTKVPAA